MTRLDQTLSFLKSRSPNHPILLEEIIQSIKTSFGRDMNQIILGQILTIVPDFYIQGWSNNRLTIDTEAELFKETVCSQRKETIKNRLTAITIQAYETH